MSKKIIIGIVLLVIILGVGYFAVKAVKHAMAPAPTAQTAVQPTPTSAQTSPTATSSSQTAQSITVEANEFAFTPSMITVKKGQPVTITFKNMGKYPHNFTLAELNVQTKTIQPGSSDTVTFTPSNTGSFTFICTVPGHADRGMKGTLTVE